MKTSTLRALCAAYEKSGAQKLDPPLAADSNVTLQVTLPKSEWDHWVRLRDNVEKYTPLTTNA